MIKSARLQQRPSNKSFDPDFENLYMIRQRFQTGKRGATVLFSDLCFACFSRFHGISQLVSIEVLVTDKKTGERIDGLKRDDFEVTDDGHTQETGLRPF